MSATDPEWINFAEPTPTLRFVNTGGKKGNEHCCLYDPNSDGEAWITAREQDFVEVGRNP